MIDERHFSPSSQTRSPKGCVEAVAGSRGPRKMPIARVRADDDRPGSSSACCGPPPFPHPPPVAMVAAIDRPRPQQEEKKS